MGRGSGRWSRRKSGRSSQRPTTRRRVGFFGAISGMTVRGLSNRDVATILGIATDQEMRNAELLRLAAWIFAEDMPALTALWLREDRWHIGMKIPCFIRPRINCTASSVPIRTVHRRLFAVTCAGARRDAYTKRPSASPNSLLYSRLRRQGVFLGVSRPAKLQQRKASRAPVATASSVRLRLVPRTKARCIVRGHVPLLWQMGACAR